jgi:uncharacterized membrane protein (DUF485 family)
MWLFFIYVAVYAVFVGLNAFWPDVMGTKIGGVNLAIVYGMALIVLAILLAVVQSWLCRDRPEIVEGRGAASEESGR